MDPASARAGNEATDGIAEAGDGLADGTADGIGESGPVGAAPTTGPPSGPPPFRWPSSTTKA